MARIVLLNALPLNAFEEFTDFGLWLRRLSPTDFANIVRELLRMGVEIECYVRHPATVALLSRLLGVELQPSTGLYRFDENDLGRIFIVTLQTPQRGQEQEPTESDLLIHQLYDITATRVGE